MQGPEPAEGHSGLCLLRGISAVGAVRAEHPPRHSQVYGAGSPCCGAGLLGRGSLDPGLVTLSDLWGHSSLPQFLHMRKGIRPEAASWCCWGQ